MAASRHNVTLSLVLPGMGPPADIHQSLKALLAAPDLRLHSLYATGIDTLPAALLAHGLTQGQPAGRISSALDRFYDGLGRHAFYGPFDRTYAAQMLGAEESRIDSLFDHDTPPLSQTAWRDVVTEAFGWQAGQPLAINGLGLGVTDLRRGIAEVLTPPHDIDRLMAATINPLQFPPLACAGLLAGHSASATPHILVDQAVRHMECDAVLVLRGDWRGTPEHVDETIGLQEEAGLIQSIEQANLRVEIIGLGPVCIDAALLAEGVTPPAISAALDEVSVRD